MTPASGSNRVNRGGSWNNNARNCRSANRNRNSPGSRNDNLGFRLLSTRRRLGTQFTDCARVPAPCPGGSSCSGEGPDKQRQPVAFGRSPGARRPPQATSSNFFRQGQSRLGGTGALEGFGQVSWRIICRWHSTDGLQASIKIRGWQALDISGWRRQRRRGSGATKRGRGLPAGSEVVDTGRVRACASNPEETVDPN